MAVNRGKDFEGAIRDAFEKHPFVSIDRFPDPMAGYAGIRNICDFGVYKYPYKFYFECKAFRGNTLNFKAAITKDQWDGLLLKAEVPGVIAGIIVWFIDYDVTYFVPIKELQRLKDAGEKSLHINHLSHEVVEHMFFPGKKKRVMFTYDALEFITNLAATESRRDPDGKAQ